MSKAFVDELSALVGFSGNPLDRLSERRDDQDVVRALEQRPDARTLVFVADTPVLRPEDEGMDPLFEIAQAAALGPVRELVLLGQDGERPFFAALLDDSACESELDPVSGKPRLFLRSRRALPLIDLRTIAVRRLLDRPTIAMLAQAKSLLHWHARHRFCSNCGAPTHVASAGWKRECAACAAQHFPRTDPVVIMLATHGERCLLGRQRRFAPGMYSALAGFVEPGETIEEAVRREILEESGVRTGRVTYLASQPWPFPASMMIGCLAEALSEHLIVDYAELEDARWFSRAEVVSMLQGDHPGGLSAPQPIAIARTLLQAWAAGPKS